MVDKTLKRLIREAGGVTGFAKNHGFTRATVYCWLNRTYQMTYPNAEKIERKTGVSAVSLIRQTKPKRGRAA